MSKPRYREINGQLVPSLRRPPNVRDFARNWDAADNNRLTSSWTRENRTIDSDLRNQLHLLQARALDAMKNDDHVKAFARLMRNNVVGPKGVRLQVRSRTSRGELDTRINEIVEAQWRRWGRVGSCDVSRKLSWCDVQRQVVNTLCWAGEAFLIEYGGRNEFGYQLQALDPRRIDPRTTDEERGVIMGVERDALGAPLRYWISKNPSVGAGTFGYGEGQRRLDEKDYTIVDADRVIHLYLPEFASQTRGVPWIAASLYRLMHLKGYEEAEVVAARVAASKLGFFEYSDVMGTKFQGDDVDADGNVITSTEPGEWQQLPPGVTANMVDPSHPTDAYPHFVKAMLRGVASGVGVSYNSLASDLEGVNYSSLRQGALEERDTYMTLQEFLVEHVHERVYTKWLANSLRRGVIPNSRPDVDAQLVKLSRVEWQPRRWQWVDPQKSAVANNLEIQAGVRSVSDVIRERGRDPQEVFEEIAAEKVIMDEMGISPAEAMPVEDDDA